MELAPARRKARMEAIIQNQDWEAMFQLEDSGDFAYCLTDPLWSLTGPDGDLNRLNHAQRVLFLCILLENCTQCDSLLSFFDEGHAVYGAETAAALEEIGAPQSAALLREVLAALPEEGYPTGGGEARRALYRGPFGAHMDRADRAMCDYPDGPMRDLYVTYAHAHREEFP